MIIDAQFEYIARKYIEYNDEVWDVFPPLPKRATAGSAGYDIITPLAINLEPGKDVYVSTLLKCRIPDGWFLTIVPRSGLGFKYFVRLANTLGVIDSDYYGNENNDGHIIVKIRNEGDQPLHLEAGKAFCQAIFLPYGVCRFEEGANAARTGGFGSTNK